MGSRGMKNTLTRGLRFLGLGLAGCLVAMAISYAVVRHLTADLRFVDIPDQATIQEARRFRGYSNELIDLANRYFEEIPLDARRLKPGARAWLEGAFQPRLNNLRRSMDQAPVPREPVYRALSAAADRAAAMASHPENGALRRRTAQEIMRATAALEAHLSHLKATPHIENPPRKPQFGHAVSASGNGSRRPPRPDPR